MFESCPSSSISTEKESTIGSTGNSQNSRFPAKPNYLSHVNTVFDLELPSNALLSSWYELRQHIKGINLRWIALNLERMTSSADIPDSQSLYLSPDLNVACLAEVNQILSSAPQKLLTRARADGSWAASYLGGPTHSAFRTIALAYLQVNEPLLKTEMVIKDLLSLQQADGSFTIYPGGPKSKAVTRLVYLALVTAMDSNEGALYKKLSLRNEVEQSLTSARKFVHSATVSTEWLLYTLLSDLCWKQMAPSIPRPFPEMPLFSYLIHFVQRAGFMNLFQSVLHQVLPGILILLKQPTNQALEPTTDSLTFSFRERLVDKFIGGLENPLFEKLEHQIIESQDGDGAWVETIIATCLNAMALKKLGYSNNHRALKRAIRYLQNSAVVTRDLTLQVNWATGNMWDTAMHADILHFLDRDSVKPIANKVFPHFMTGFREDGRWSFSIAGKVTDNDSTAMTLASLSHLYSSLDSIQQSNARKIIRRACSALIAHQQTDGGWATFDADAISSIGYKLPSPEQGAFFDFSSPDVTGRVIYGLLAAAATGCLSEHANQSIQLAIRKSYQYFYKAQGQRGLASGSYWSRWLLGPIAGTCFVTIALRGNGVSTEDKLLAKPRSFILRTQHQETGGWGESRQADCTSNEVGQGPSTPLQTGLAIMGLIACSAENDPISAAAINRGIQFLLASQENGHWEDKWPLGTILTGLDYFITPENSEVAILAALKLYTKYKTQGSKAAIDYWVTRKSISQVAARNNPHSDSFSSRYHEVAPI